MTSFLMLFVVCTFMAWFVRFCENRDILVIETQFWKVLRPQNLGKSETILGHLEVFFGYLATYKNSLKPLFLK